MPKFFFGDGRGVIHEILLMFWDLTAYPLGIDSSTPQACSLSGPLKRIKRIHDKALGGVGVDVFEPGLRVGEWTILL